MKVNISEIATKEVKALQGSVELEKLAIELLTEYYRDHSIALIRAYETWNILLDNRLYR